MEPADLHRQRATAPTPPQVEQIDARIPITTAPGHRRNSMSIVNQFVRGVARRSMGQTDLSRSANWTINTYEFRVRLVVSFKDSDIFYNTIQRRIVDIRDEPYTNSFAQLKPPSDELLREFAETVESRPKPKVSFSTGRPVFREIYYFNNKVQTWFSILNDKPVDGIRPPDTEEFLLL